MTGDVVNVSPTGGEPQPGGPRPCYWSEEGDGSRYLIPGCMARIMNPDLEECTCPSLDRQLANAREELATVRREKAGLQQWHDAIVRAVYDHRDVVRIMHAASQRVPGAGRGPSPSSPTRPTPPVDDPDMQTAAPEQTTPA